jgi:hypothetical protein
MVLQNERNELLAAWRALSGTVQAGEGWRTIPLSGHKSIRAGRHFPGNEEALLVGFTSITIPPTHHLPQGRGFLVAKVDIHDQCDRHWLVLERRPDGSLDLLTTMVLDVIDTIRSAKAISEERSFHLFLTRIRAWQDFMRRGTDATLGPQAEIGLYGELIALVCTVSAGLHPAVPIEGWEGPLNGVQDFILGTGAIEVKTTIASAGFPATIESLDQLDDSTRKPLFLAAVRLRVDDSGTSLPQIVEQARALVGDDPARNTLDTKLLHAGYFDVAAHHYQRRFDTVEFRVIPVTVEFPRLTKTTVPSGIMGARYELDLDKTTAGTFGIREALVQLGVL